MWCCPLVRKQMACCYIVSIAGWESAQSMTCAISVEHGSGNCTKTATKEKNIKVLWPNNIETFVSEGDNWFSSAEKAGLEIPTGCLTGSCGACEIDVNGETIRACISEIKNSKKCSLKVSLTTDPFWET